MVCCYIIFIMLGCSYIVHHLRTVASYTFLHEAEKIAPHKWTEAEEHPASLFFLFSTWLLKGPQATLINVIIGDVDFPRYFVQEVMQQLGYSRDLIEYSAKTQKIKIVTDRKKMFHNANCIQHTWSNICKYIQYNIKSLTLLLASHITAINPQQTLDFFQLKFSTCCMYPGSMTVMSLDCWTTSILSL